MSNTINLAFAANGGYMPSAAGPPPGASTTLFDGFRYDGQVESVQVASRAALTAIDYQLSTLLNAPGDAALAVSQGLAAIALLPPDDEIGFALALAAMLANYVAAIVAAAAAAPDPLPPAGYAYASRLPPLPADPSYGLGALAMIGAAIVPANISGQIAANWQALTALVEGNAATALATLYAQTEFTSAGDAETARQQIFDLIVAQIGIAENAGNDALVGAWRGLFTAAVTDLTVRATGLPLVADLSLAAPLPAAWLAQLLYQDGADAAVLVQRNAAPHPLFMPRVIEYLTGLA